jgi:hypothetical protein
LSICGINAFFTVELLVRWQNLSEFVLLEQDIETGGLALLVVGPVQEKFRLNRMNPRDTGSNQEKQRKECSVIA